jgi:hypothetical protein
MSERVSDERLAELAAHFDKQVQRMRVLGHHKDDGDILVQNNDTAAALRELQQWRSGVEPSTGSPIGTFVVMEPWTDDTE